MEKIDLHAHCVPASYREYCLENDFAGRGHPDGMPAIPVSHQPEILKIETGSSADLDRIGMRFLTLS